MSNSFVTNIPSLKSTNGDFRNVTSKKVTAKTVEAKEIELNGKSILEYLSGVTVAIKHANDTRETVTENDLWGQWVENVNGESIIHDGFIEKNWPPTTVWNSSITKVEDNKAYIGDTFFANIQTDMIEDGSYYFNGCDMTSFSSGLSSLKNAESMFESNSDFSEFNVSSLPKLENATKMFYRTNLASFVTDLPFLVESNDMFYECSLLSSFTISVPLLKSADSMFFQCEALTKVESDFSSLKSAKNMFAYCALLAEFENKLPALENATNMFQGCSDLVSFTSDLPKLASARQMFFGATKLEHFVGSLFSLEDGDSMFGKCILSPLSVTYILDSLPKSEELRYITIGINVQSSDTVGLEENERQLAEFAKEMDYDSWAEVQQAFIDKNWDVAFQFNKTTTTRGINNESQPLFVKLVEFAEDEYPMYSSEDGAKFYNLVWGHATTHPENYNIYGSLEEAVEFYNLIPCETSSEAQ